MLVRALCDHYHGTLRKEGTEFEHSGPLYEHIEPVEPPKKRPVNQTARRNLRAD